MQVIFFVLLSLILVCSSSMRQIVSSYSRHHHIVTRQTNGTDEPTEIEYMDMSNFKVYDSSANVSTTLESAPEIKFLTFKRSNPSQCLNGWSVNFPSHEKHMIYAHGYATTSLNDAVEIKNSTFNGTDDIDTVTLLDWRNYSLPYAGASAFLPPSNYETVALHNVPKVAAELKEFILRHFDKGYHIYLVGFSLGAHTVGTAARKVTATRPDWILPRITGLDPAGPIFEHSNVGVLPVFRVNRTNTLRPSDAALVDVVHANSTAGMQNNAGHLDIYFFENVCEPWDIACYHHKTVQIYITSLITCSLITCPANLIKRSGSWFSDREYICDTTDASKISSLGYLADRYEGRNRHELYLYRTRFSFPISTGNCSTFQNVNLPAKNRICNSSPGDAANSESCTGKPYLTTCQLSCQSNSVCTYEGHSLSASKIQAFQSNAAGTTWSPQGCTRKHSCRNEDGEPISFFIAYKLNNSSNYFLIEPDGQGIVQPIRVGKYGVHQSKSVFAQTLSPIYNVSSSSSINHLMWNGNDNHQMGNATGHFSRGVLAFNSISGFLLLHSIPRFPNPGTTAHYEFPESEKEHAHIAICTSLYNNEKAHLKLISFVVENMKTFYPNVYSSQLTDEVIPNENLMWKLQNLINPLNSLDNEVLPSPIIKHLILNMEPGIVLFTMGRSMQPSNIFEQLAYSYQSNLISKTWGHENESSMSCGKPYTVENIRQITILNRTIHREQDHSSWAILKPPQHTHYPQLPPRIIRTCIGDWNRAPNSTTGRGGMLICTWNKKIYNIFNAFNSKIDKCTDGEGRHAHEGVNTSRINSNTSNNNNF